MRTPEVVVIGGGLAGLQAAIHCADSGADVTLLESRSRLGGATWSKHHRGLGFEIDNGQHVFMRCCEEYLAFLDRLGVRDLVEMQERLEVPVARPGARLTWIRRNGLPAPAHLAKSILTYQPLSLAARLHAAWTAQAISRLDPLDPALDEKSIGDWLAEHGESELAIENFWELLIRSTLNLRAREASLALATKVLRTGFLDRADGADIGWSKVPLSELHAEPAQRILEELGATIQLRTSVDALEVVRGQRPVVHTKNLRLEPDAVILAVPHDVAAQLLPKRSEIGPANLDSLGSSAIVNLHVVFDRPIMSLPFMAGIDSELQWVFDRTKTSGLEEGQYLTVSLSDGDAYLDRSVEDLRAIFLPEFTALFPEAKHAVVLKFAVTIERRATFRQKPGTRRHRPMAGRVADGVFIAGAFTDTGWPATMEGAVRSGRAAAIEAMKRLKGFSSFEETEAA